MVGRDAREAVVSKVPELRKKYKIDAVIVNAENAVNGFGLTAQVCDDFYKAGVDCITTGNHVWDQRSIISYIDKDKKLLRPANLPANTPGRGACIIEAGKYKILVVNLLGRLFMDLADDPFAKIDDILKNNEMGNDLNAIVVDFHAEATSEKVAMGHFCDGRASLVVGTHTHIPTADVQILSKGTGYQTDTGMCGVYDSVIGMEKDSATGRFTRKVPGDRLKPAEGAVTLCGVLVDINSKTGLCNKIQPVRIGGILQESIPDAR